MTPYSLRHAFASLLVKSGLNVVEIAAQLGHGPGVTLSTYAHLLDSLGDGRLDGDAEIRRAREKIAAVAQDGSAESIRTRGAVTA